MKNFLKATFRNLTRSKSNTLINILGLSVGLSCCILVLLYIKDELSYNKFHEKRDSIYRVVEMFPREGDSFYTANSPAPLAYALKNEFPEILEVIRFGAGRGDIVTYGEMQTRDNQFLFADPNVFQVFTIPLIHGDPNTALDELSCVVISEDMAEKYFAEENPVGKILQIGTDTYTRDYRVTGVFENLPTNSSLQLDCLASFQHNYITGNEGNLTWGAHNYTTFVLLQDGVESDYLESKFPVIAEKYIDERFQPESAGSKIQYHLQSLNKIHLDLNPANRLPTERENFQIYVFAGMGFLILLIASINFINLSTAQVSNRKKEIGIRKVVGARRMSLAKQFLGESITLSLVAFILSLLIVELALPVFNMYIDKELVFIHGENFPFILSLIFLAIFTGFFAGSYPAFFLSSFKPATILRGRFSTEQCATKTGSRKTLVVTQFVFSAVFIVATLVMHSQLKYIKNKNLGYSKEHLVVIPVHAQDVKTKYRLYKTSILTSPDILGVTATSYLPSERGYRQNVSFENPENNSMRYISWIPADYDFIETLCLEITQGRNFSREYSTDVGKAYILNESAVKQIGWDNPLGKQMKIVNWGSVVGVVEDFHFQSLHQHIQPMALYIYPDLFKYLLVRINPEKANSTLGFLEDQWKQIFPNHQFEYTFLEEDFDRLYNSEIRLGNVFSYITSLALFVACLGLFGLVSMVTSSRTKEVGIRKVLGASVGQVMKLLGSWFVKLIIVANVIAWPLAWYAMHRWLQNFAYRIDLTIFPFLLAGVMALVIAMFTVSWQTIRAARANPVESLRYE